MAGIELIIFGLALDAVGAILIVKPFLRLFTVQRADTGEVTSRTTKTAQSRPVQKYAWFGVGFFMFRILFSSNRCFVTISGNPATHTINF